MRIIVGSDVACERKEKYVHEGIDLEFAKAEKISEWLGGAEIVNDETEESTEELSVGRTSRGYAKDFLDTLALNQYGVCCKDGKIAVAGHFTMSTALACDYLLTLDREVVKEGFKAVLTNDAWTADFMEPDATLVSATDCCFDNLETVYSASKEVYEKYIADLKGNGYELSFSNEICGNMFNRFKKGNAFLSASYSPSEEYIRVISGSLDKNKFVDVLKTGGENISEVTVTQMTLDYISGSFGMCYIITLKDGSFAIFDGGHVRVVNGYPKTYDYVRLYTLLKELNKRPDGKIVISAWFMTHEHADHFNVFYWFCKQYGSEVTLKAYCACPCSNAVAYNAQNPEYHTVNGQLKEALENVGGADIVTLQTGDKFSLCDVDFEVIFTIDDLCPKRLRRFNDCSFVSKMTYDGQAIMWLGDAGIAPSKLIRKRYTPEYLKCDIVNVSHHGYNGIEPELYDIIDAKVWLWSLYYRIVEGFLAEGADTSLDYVQYARKIHSMENPPRIFYHKGSNYTLNLPYHGEEDLTKR